jgi:hypothetical protein
LGQFAIENGNFKITKGSDFLSRYKELDGKPLAEAERAIANWMHSSRIAVVEADGHPKADDLAFSHNYLDRLIATKMHPNAGQMSKLATDPHEEVRLALVQLHDLPKKVLNQLIGDHSARVKAHALDSRHVTPAMIRGMIEGASTADLHSFLTHPQIEEKDIDAILQHPNASFGVKSEALMTGKASADALVRIIQSAIHNPNDENLSLAHAAMNSPQMPEQLIGDMLTNSKDQQIKEMAGSNYRVPEHALQQFFVDSGSEPDIKRYILTHNPSVSASIASMAVNDPDSEVRSIAQKIVENQKQSDVEFGGGADADPA